MLAERREAEPEGTGRAMGKSRDWSVSRAPGCDTRSRGCCGVPGALCSQGAFGGGLSPWVLNSETEEMRDTCSHHFAGCCCRGCGGPGGGGIEVMRRQRSEEVSGVCAAWKGCPAQGGEGSSCGGMC